MTPQEWLSELGKVAVPKDKESPMTPQEIWWNTYWTALTGLCANPNGCPMPVTDMAETIADETVRAFVASDGTVYDPRPSDYGVGK